MYKLGLVNAETPEIKLTTSTESWRKQGNSKTTSISALLTILNPLTVWITTNCGKFLRRWEYQTCLLTNLYAGQEAKVRTGHGTMVWFKIGRRICRGCMCKVHHVKCKAGWLTNWNQDCQEKYQQPQIHRWCHSNGRKRRGTKEPLDKGERWVKKLAWNCTFKKVKSWHLVPSLHGK